MIVKKNLLVSKYKFQVLNNELINKNPSSGLKKKKSQILLLKISLAQGNICELEPDDLFYRTDQNGIGTEITNLRAGMFIFFGVLFSGS